MCTCEDHRDVEVTKHRLHLTPPNTQSLPPHQKKRENPFPF